MLKYDQAVGAMSPRERQEARDWLLQYNRDDVEATRVCVHGWRRRISHRSSRLRGTRAQPMSLDPRSDNTVCHAVRLARLRIRGRVSTAKPTYNVRRLRHDRI